MSQASPVGQPIANRCLCVSGIDWDTYSRLLRIFAERPGIHLAYDRGELEIMSPLLEHDEVGRFLGELIFVLTEELGLPLKRGGSVTMRRRRLRRGLEADECFWIANASRMAGRRRLDLRTDPPPDLALEIDVTRSSLDRLSMYAALGVPEVWRLEGDTLTCYVLRPDAQYEITATSRSFPRLTPADLVQFVMLARQATDEHIVVRQFRAWVRQRLIPPPAPTS